MKQITWTPGFSVGVASIDEQHKWLIGIVNRLIAEPRITTKSETISHVLSELTKYAEEHFATEEALMLQHRYPRLEEHIAQHRAFRKTTADFCMATLNDDGSVPETMLAYLRDWVEEHILRTDMEFKPFFRERGLR